MALRWAMVAGEASGDLLASLLMQGLSARWPRSTYAGIGGLRMQALGFEPWWPSDKLAVRGYVEVLRHYREITGIRRELVARLLTDPPAAFIGVDAPDFNLEVEARMKAAGVPAVHFVSPSIWAWRGGRIDKIRRSVDHVLCLFPFEPAIYERAGVPATYVGHPLADVIPLDPPSQAARQALGLKAADQVVAILPGSRQSEAQYLAEPFLQAVRELKRRRTGLQCVLPMAPGLHERVQAAARAAGCQADDVMLVEGRSHEVLAACDVAMVASGTATLEAALFKRPMVIAYRMHPLSWQLMKRMAYQPWVGLPNILCESFVVPELLQSQVTAAALADAVLAWLDDVPACAALQARFEALHHVLRQDTAKAASDAIASLVPER